MRAVTCATHHHEPRAAAHPGNGRERRRRSADGTNSWDPLEQFPARLGDAGGAGGGSSARAFATEQVRVYRAGVRATWGPLAPLVLLLRPHDSAVRAAQKGAAGEERTAAFLDGLAAKSKGTIVVLHDRTIPGRRENIDHIVIAPSGVWAVDAKAYAGLLSTGGRWTRTRSLTIGQREGEKLIRQSNRQQQHLRTAYPRLTLPADLPTHGALCFVDGTWSPGADGSQVESVWIVSPRRLRKLLRAPGPLSVEQVRYAADHLSRAFVPATWR